MAAYNVTQPPDATGQQIDTNAASGLQQIKGTFDTHPNFNGPAGKVFRNLTVTSINELPIGMLFTALYAEYALNTITVQFTAPTVSASTTVSDWTLSGPSAPSITSVTYLTGSRSVLLNLSGPLVASNTYTLSIAKNKVLSGSQMLQPKDGTYNWPSLTVEVIQPAQIDCVGVGINQTIVLGDPNLNTAGDAVGVGIDQPIDLGTPTVNTLISTTGVGIDQTIDLGTPFDYTQATPIGVGIAQTVALGTPVMTVEQQPVGVGINQTIDLGSPVADITPLEPVGVGINQTITLGTPVTAGPANTVGVGINQTIALGTPNVDAASNVEFFGVGINQTIGVGGSVDGPVADLYPIVTSGVGINQTITLGTPQSTATPQVAGVGINQTITLGTPTTDITPLEPEGVGINQVIAVGVPYTPPIQSFGIGIDQTVAMGAVNATITPLTPTEVGIAQNVVLGTPHQTGALTVPGSGFSQPVGVGTPLMGVPQIFNVPGIQQNIDLGAPEAVRAGALVVTASQAAALISLDAALHQAFGDGVKGPVTDPLIDPIDGYTDDFTTLQQQQVRTIFEDDAAAAVTAFNIPGAFPNTNNNDTASLAKLAPTGSTATLTFIDGILVTATVVRNIECIGVGINQTIGVGTPNVTRT